MLADDEEERGAATGPAGAVPGGGAAQQLSADEALALRLLQEEYEEHEAAQRQAASTVGGGGGLPPPLPSPLDVSRPRPRHRRRRHSSGRRQHPYWPLADPDAGPAASGGGDDNDDDLDDLDDSRYTYDDDTADDDADGAGLTAEQREELWAELNVLRRGGGTLGLAAPRGRAPWLHAPRVLPPSLARAAPHPAGDGGWGGPPWPLQAPRRHRAPPAAVGESYEELLALDDTVPRRGVTGAALDRVSAVQSLDAAAAAVAGRCAICLGDYAAGERARRLPCLCLFHDACLVQHLAASTTCPICRLDVPSAAP
jgi:hypothetical protein